MKTNLKSKLLVIALVLSSLLASQQAFAQPATGTLGETGTGNTTLNLTSGATFQLDLNIVVSFSSVGATYFFQVSPGGSGLFSVTARLNQPGNPYPDNTTADGTAFTGPNGLLDPVNNNDLGGTCNTCPVNPGSFFLSTFTFTISGAIAPGQYLLFLDSRAIVADSDFADHTLNTNVVTINIIPEPATTGLAVLGGVMLLAFVWKARRVMA